MCELLAVCSDQSVTIDLSLHRFSAHGGQDGPHRDGWGVAFYQGRDARLIKEADAAAESPWIRFLEQNPQNSLVTVAHLRRATTGARTHANTQPFIRELGGRIHVFAHNGHLPGLGRTPEFSPGRFHPVGETDSELAFCALLERVSDCWQETPGEVPDLERRLEQVSAFAAAIRPFGPANFSPLMAMRYSRTGTGGATPQRERSKRRGWFPCVAGVVATSGDSLPAAWRSAASIRW
ncbi:MAG: class II glutamine amidotransferase [Gammaproteobacteria bacterium]|nr:class II glutamine amidotransferase [Gammaproteobacteria bacterium]